MAQVTVMPETFELIAFDAGEIARIAGEVADLVGLDPEVRVDVVVDEAMLIARSVTTLAGGNVRIEATGGAFESLRQPRTFDPERCRTVLGQMLLRAHDRLDPKFGSPPEDGELSVDLEAAWATYVEGRLDRLGVVRGRPIRRVYQFRVRHGFNDAVDAAFDRLWNGPDLSFDDIARLSSEAAGATVPA